MTRRILDHVPRHPEQGYQRAGVLLPGGTIGFSFVDPWGSAPLHRARSAAAALASRVDPITQSQGRHPLVTLAPTPPAACQTMSLAATEQNS